MPSARFHMCRTEQAGIRSPCKNRDFFRALNTMQKRRKKQTTRTCLHALRLSVGPAGKRQPRASCS
ncbi:hypothetical protein BKA80DRAFT_280074 [Phyllosticta citrichinensis]